MIHNVSVVLNKLFSNENLEIFERRENQTIFNLLVIMLHYWITKVIQTDNFLLNALTELLEVLTKSVFFCKNFDKTPNKQVLSKLMMATKYDFISSQTRSRLIKIISYLSKGVYHNTFKSKNPQKNYLPKD